MKLANQRWHDKVFLFNLRLTTIGWALYERRYPRAMRRKHVFYSNAAQRNSAKQGRSFSMRKLGRAKYRNAWSTGGAMRLRYLERLRKGWPKQNLGRGDYSAWAAVRANKPAPVNHKYAVRRFNNPARPKLKVPTRNTYVQTLSARMRFRLRLPVIRDRLRRQLEPIFALERARAKLEQNSRPRE